jgi:glycosyltransferase involved in cell wall biosynthesis
MADVKVGAVAVTTPGLVEVLLGTHNGERFLREQIDSILQQDYPSVRILARDDASTDETVAILSHYAQQAPERFTVLPGREPSGGAQWNFLRLMQASEAAFVCFADQDDVWRPDKISRSMRALHDLEASYGANVPLLVFSDLRVVDEELHSLHESYWANEVICADDIHRLPRILQQNVVTGCTATLNRALVNLALRMPPEAPMHDYWVALIASTMGHAAPLKEATVLYRQHGGNVVGATIGKSSPAELVQRALVSNGRRAQWIIQQRAAAAFLRVYGNEIPGAKRVVLETYLECGAARSGWTRVRMLFRHGFLRRGLLRNLATAWELLRTPPT